MGFPDEFARVVIKEGIALVGQHGNMIAVSSQGDDMLVLELQMALAIRVMRLRPLSDAIHTFCLASSVICS